MKKVVLQQLSVRNSGAASGKRRPGMKILMTSIVDLKKSQHNRPHQLVKYLSKKHEIMVHSINE